jgi:DNA-binding GntR family transcriptional regulator
MESSVQLPTETQLVGEFGVSRQTVRRAYQELEADGLVERIPGRGTFSIPKASHPVYHALGAVEDLMELSIDTKMRLISKLALVDSPETARMLQLEEPRVGRAQLVRLYRSKVFCVSDIAMPPSIAERILAQKLLPTAGSITFVEILDELLAAESSEGEQQRVGVYGAIQKMHAVACEADLAERLDVEPGTAILRAERLYYDRTGAYVGLAETSYSPLLYTYKIDLRRRDSRR